MTFKWTLGSVVQTRYICLTLTPVWGIKKEVYEIDHAVCGFPQFTILSALRNLRMSRFTSNIQLGILPKRSLHLIFFLQIYVSVE